MLYTYFAPNIYHFVLQSVIRVCFHERRLQYMEKEKILAWQVSRPGERIVELDIPLSYGLFDVEQDSNMLNALSFLWDPTKEVGAYIKVVPLFFFFFNYRLFNILTV